MLNKQNFGVNNKTYYGMLWYFLEWSIKFTPLVYLLSINSNYLSRVKNSTTVRPPVLIPYYSKKIKV